MNEDDGLEIAIEAKAQNARKNLKELINDLNYTAREIKSIQTTLNNKTGTEKTLVNIKEGLKQIRLQVDETGKLIKSTIKSTSPQTLSQNLSNIVQQNIGKFYLLWNLTKRIRDTIKGWVTNSVDFQETVNLFNVSMGSAYQEATKFQNKLSEAFGTSRTEMMKFQATYKNIMSSMGNLSTQTTEKISETLTLMALDYSSLFNVKQDTAMTKIQSALTGSIRPIRAESGYDISDLTITAKAQELGVEKSSSELSQMEKRLLRIIVLMEQMRNTGAMNDLARTIESQSNQIKVLQNQLQELGVWLGNVFIGTIGQILPYINGFVMALKEIVKTLAIFVGYKDTTTGLGDVFETTDESTGDIANNLGSASASAKELKRTLMGFDVLNVITTPKDSSGGGGASSGVGTIDPKILDALKDYDSLMEKVRMKATDIRDKIMDWLGFIKKINPLTGEISWELRDGLTRLEKILDVVKLIGTAFLSWKVSKTITNLLKNLGILNKTQAFQLAFGITLTATGIFAQYMGTKHLLDGDVDIFTLLETFLGTAGGTFGIVSILKATKWGKTLSLGKQISIGLGIMLALQQIQIGTEALKEGDIGKAIITQLANGIGGFVIGYKLGGWKIGLTIALAVTAITTISELISSDVLKFEDVNKNAMESIKERNKATKEYIQSLKDERKAIEDEMNTSLIQIGYTEKLITELGNLVDQNGNVIDGYEDRVSFILNQLNSSLGTEYSLVNNQITQNGKLVTSYNEIENSISKIIEMKKAEIVLEANKEVYQNALKERMNIYKNLQKAQSEYNESLQELYYATESNLNTDDLEDYVADTLKTLNEAKEAYSQNARDIIYFENLQTAVITEDREKINQAVSDITSTYESEGEKVQANLADRIVDAKNFAEQSKQIYAENGKEINEQEEARLNAGITTLTNKLLEQSQTIEALTPSILENWKTLAKDSTETYNSIISSLPEDVRLVIETMSGTVNSTSPEQLEKWVNLAKTNEQGFVNGLSKLPEDTRTKIMEMLTAVANQQGATSVAGINLGTTFKNSVESVKADLSNSITMDENSTRSKLSNFGTKISKILKDIIPSVSLVGNLVGGVFGIKARASGGIPPVGELFLSREAGPEFVGRMGNRNVVANNDQIVASVSQGVANAVRSVLGNGFNNGASYNLYLDGKQITDVVQKRININDNVVGA